MHTLLYSGNFELLEKLIKACPNQDPILERAVRGKARNEEDNQHLKNIIAIMEAKKEELKNKKQMMVWSEQPMFKALNQERFGLLGIFLLLGGNINTRTDGGSASLFDRLLQKILEKPEVLNDLSKWIPWTLTRIRDKSGNTLLLRATFDIPEVLLCHNVRMRNSKFGTTALHNAAEGGQLD